MKIHKDLMRTIFSLVLILSIVFALSAFMLFDFYQFYRLSINQVSVSVSDWKGEINHYSPGSLVSLLFSPLQFLGTPLWKNTLNLTRFSHLVVLPYVGIIPILLAIMSLGKNRKENRLSVFFALFPCILIFNILGGIQLLYRLLGEFLFPLTRLFWAKYLGTLYFSIAVLAGLGFENFKNKNLLPRWITLLSVTESARPRSAP